MAAETGFLIDGTVYEVPTLYSLSMSERNVMFELCGYVQEDFLQKDNESDDDYLERADAMAHHPGYLQALMHIAYQRGNPTVKRDKVRFVVDQTNFFDAVATMVGDEPEEPEDDAVPLALTTPPDGPSPSEPSSPSDSTEPTNESGGTASTNGSDEPDSLPTAIGTTRSATSSPGSPVTESAA